MFDFILFFLWFFLSGCFLVILLLIVFYIFFAKINFLCWSWCHNLNGFYQHNFNAIPNEEEFADPFWNATYVRGKNLGRTQDSWFSSLKNTISRLNILWRSYQKHVWKTAQPASQNSQCQCWGSCHEKTAWLKTARLAWATNRARAERFLHRHPVRHLGTLVCKKSLSHPVKQILHHLHFQSWCHLGSVSIL